MELPSIRFLYRKHAEHRFVPANGAHGGVSPRGDYRIDFFIESAGIPEYVIHSLTGDGLGPETDRKPLQSVEKKVLEREVVASIMLPIAQAKGLAEWILENITAFEKEVQRKNQE